MFRLERRERFEKRKARAKLGYLTRGTKKESKRCVDLSRSIRMKMLQGLQMRRSHVAWHAQCWSRVGPIHTGHANAAENMLPDLAFSDSLDGEITDNPKKKKKKKKRNDFSPS